MWMIGGVMGAVMAVSGCDRAVIDPCGTACDDMFPVVTDASADDPNYRKWALCVASCPDPGPMGEGGEECAWDEMTCEDEEG
jgi:hypothetical protein